jgi:hypothetical protein
VMKFLNGKYIITFQIRCLDFFLKEPSKCHIYTPWTICPRKRDESCHLWLLLAFASTVILKSKSCRTHDHILLSQIRPGGRGPCIYIHQEQGILLSKITPRYFTWLMKGIFRPFSVRGVLGVLSLWEKWMT